MKMEPEERLFWYREARRARHRGLIDMARAASVPYIGDDGREQFYQSCEEEVTLYAGEKAQQKRALQAMYARNRAALKAELG